MDGQSERLVERMTQAERACAALDKTVRELRRFQREDRPTRAIPIPALARQRVLGEGSAAPDGGQPAGLAAGA
jgi:hypothetical protein